MKLNVPEVVKIRAEWTRLPDTGWIGTGEKFLDYFKVYNRHDKEVGVSDWYGFYVEPGTTRMAFKLDKDYWAKGRKMRIESRLDKVTSGEYVVTWKAEANSYDKVDFVVIEFANPTITTPKQALSWIEQQIAIMEAKDGLTTQQIIAEMRVR